MRGFVGGALAALVLGGLVAAPAPALADAELRAWADAVVTPADPGYRGQWGIVRSRVNQAWATARGGAAVTVAVVDTGVAALPDLAPHLLPGHDFVNHDDDPADDNGHGTMAAGVIAASANNATGIAGVCWFCKILPVKVLGKDGSGSYADIEAGIRYAADRGAAVISLSLGGPADSAELRAAVTYAAAKGSLVVAAAGNAGSAAPHYPAAVPSVLAVGASTVTDTRYPWSDYGLGWVDVAAPGCAPAQNLAGEVKPYCGTSVATPFTAGVAALLAAARPGSAAGTLRAALTSSAAPLVGNWVASGSGRVDAAAALAALPKAAADHAAPRVAFLSPAAGALTRGVLAVRALATDDAGVARVQLYANGRLVATDTAAPYTLLWNSAPISGTVALSLRAYDFAGNTVAVGRAVTVRNAAPR